jgi:hypothetical protein
MGDTLHERRVALEQRLLDRPRFHGQQEDFWQTPSAGSVLCYVSRARPNLTLPPWQAPHILPARPNPEREFVSLPFLAGGPRGTSSQKNRESNMKRATSQAWIAHRKNIEQISTKGWAGNPTLKPRESSRSNPPPAEVYRERVNDLPSGFKKWNVSMHWGRIKTRKEALQAILGNANLGPDARAMAKWQEDHKIRKLPPGAPHPRLFERDSPLELCYMRSHSSMDDPWAPVRMVPC